MNNQEDRNIYNPPFGVETSTERRQHGDPARAVDRARGRPACRSARRRRSSRTRRWPRTTRATAGSASTRRAFGFTDEDSARFFLRLGYDDRNYYEYSRPDPGRAPAPFRPTPWQRSCSNLTDFTDLKLDRPSGAVADTVDARGRALRRRRLADVHAHPAASRSASTARRRFADSSLGARAARTMSGQVWIDDLRALDVDRSRASRTG